MKFGISSVNSAILAALGGCFPSRRALRLYAYFGCVSLGLSLLGVRALHAAAREDAFAIGHELIGLSDLTRDAESVSLNGQRFHHASTVTSEPLPRVLDRLVEHCRRDPGGAARAIEQAASVDATRFRRRAPEGELRRAVFREESERRGMVLCFVGGPEHDGIASWLAALKRFAKTRDLSELGKLRYSFVETVEPGRAHVVTLWADSGLNLAALFPEAGDAAGTDSSIVPRLPNARRTLAASAEGMPFGVRTYSTTDSVVAVQRFYDSWMSAHGWQIAHDERFAASSYLRDDGSQVFLSLLTNDARTTFATITETGVGHANAELAIGGEP